MNWLQEFRVVFLNCYGYDLFSKGPILFALSAISTAWLLCYGFALLDQSFTYSDPANEKLFQYLPYVGGVISIAAFSLSFASLNSKKNAKNTRIMMTSLEPKVQYRRLIGLSVNKNRIWLYLNATSFIVFPLVFLTFFASFGLVIGYEAVLYEGDELFSFALTYILMVSLSRLYFAPWQGALCVVAAFALGFVLWSQLNQSNWFAVIPMAGLIILIQFLAFKRFINMEIAT